MADESGLYLRGTQSRLNSPGLKAVFGNFRFESTGVPYSSLAKHASCFCVSNFRFCFSVAFLMVGSKTGVGGFGREQVNRKKEL
jgi:hypothetical protein